MAARSGWESRSESYRSRLLGAGGSGKLSGEAMSPAQTRAYWEGGGDLRGGRSHRPRPIGAAPKRATEREAAGDGDAATYKALEAWRRRKGPTGPPSWLQDKRRWKRTGASMAIDVQVVGSDLVRRTGSPDLPPAHTGNRMDESVVSTDTAAILSQIDIPPSRWKSVEMTIRSDGKVDLTIQPKGNAYPRTVRFPDYQSAQEVGRLLNLSKK